jgi:hypothetical protein
VAGLALGKFVGHARDAQHHDGAAGELCDRASSWLAGTAVGGQGGHAAPDQGHACRIRLQLRKIKHTQLCWRSGPRQARDKSEILSEKEPGQLGGDFEVARLHRGEGWSAVKDLPQN